jgi:hypothetical protein
VRGKPKHPVVILQIGGHVPITATATGGRHLGILASGMTALRPQSHSFVVDFRRRSGRRCANDEAPDHN